MYIVSCHMITHDMETDLVLLFFLAPTSGRLWQDSVDTLLCLLVIGIVVARLTRTLDFTACKTNTHTFI